MGKFVLVLMICVLCTACAAREFETVSDLLPEATQALSREMVVDCPPASATLGEETGWLRIYEGYTLSQEILPGGDLQRTLGEVTGKADRPVYCTRMDDWVRYEGVYTVAGETGEVICRLVILDDGKYHYVLLAQTPAGEYKSHRQEIEAISRSFTLG